MKVGILTYHDTTNYGANLQAYSLDKAIAQLGIDAELINYQCKNIIKREHPNLHLYLSIHVRSCLRNNMQRIKTYFAHKKKLKAFRKFMEENSRISKLRYNKKNISKANDCYNKFLVGSDLLWNLEISGNDTTFFLDFVKDNSKKNSYATSIGKRWDEDKIGLIGNLLKSFTYIGVREDSSIALINEVSGKNAVLNSDPTMLIDPKDWLKIVNANIWGDYVFYYMGDEKCKSDAVIFAQGHGLKLVEIEFTDTIEFFLTKIKHAKYVFTGSYHGLLFSLYFHTNFVYYNFQDFERIEYLEKEFRIQNSNSKNIASLNSIPAVDWNYVDVKLKKLKSRSLEYLKLILA